MTQSFNEAFSTEAQAAGFFFRVGVETEGRDLSFDIFVKKTMMKMLKLESKMSVEGFVEKNE